MDSLTRREQPDRSKINMHQSHELKYWTHQRGVSKERLQARGFEKDAPLHGIHECLP
jgi:hypothetical protein